MRVEDIDRLIALTQRPGIRKVQDVVDVLLDARNVALLEAAVSGAEETDTGQA